jgi:hypothetical protein
MVSAQPAAAVTDATVRLVVTARFTTMEPALPAWNVARAPMAGAAPVVFWR